MICQDDFSRPCCWDDTIFRGRNNEPEVPEEILSSHVEVQEEMMQKVTIGLDQMFIEDDVEGNEDVQTIQYSISN